jgi:hypothetical protein
MTLGANDSLADFGCLQTDETIKLSIMDNYKAYKGDWELRAAVGKIHNFRRTVRRHPIQANDALSACRFRLESTWGLFAGYGRDGWRMQKKTPGTDEYE